MLAYDEGLYRLDEPAKKYVPELETHGKEKITVRELLLHESGLPHCNQSLQIHDGHRIIHG